MLSMDMTYFMTICGPLTCVIAVVDFFWDRISCWKTLRSQSDKVRHLIFTALLLSRKKIV